MKQYIGQCNCRIDRYINNTPKLRFTVFVMVCYPSVLFTLFNTLRPRQDGCHFPDDVFKCIFLNENAWISIKISLKFVPKVRINNIPALVQIMAWRRPGGKPLSEPMMVSLLTHICVTRPQWVNVTSLSRNQSYNCPSVNEIKRIWVNMPHESMRISWYSHSKIKHDKTVCISYRPYCGSHLEKL